MSCSLYARMPQHDGSTDRTRLRDVYSILYVHAHSLVSDGARPGERVPSAARASVRQRDACAYMY